MESDAKNDYYALIESNMYTTSDLFVNKEVLLSKTITENDVDTFIKLSGDNNPIHHDENFARKTMFKGRIAHGLLAMGLISAGLTRLMGPGNVWLSQNFEFLKPIRLNDYLTAKLKILEIQNNNVCIVETICSNQKGELIIKGLANSRLFHISGEKKPV